MLDSAEAKFQVPKGVQTQLDTANKYIAQEQERLTSLQSALTSGLPSAYKALGLTPEGDTTTQQMMNQLLAGGSLDDLSPWAQEVGRGPAPQEVADPGARPADYVFKGKSRSKNDRKAEEQVKAAQAEWDKKSTAYQAYLKQKAAYDAAPTEKDTSAAAAAAQQAQYQYQQFQQALGQSTGQLEAEQNLLGQLKSQTSADPEWVSQLNQQLGGAIEGSPEWQQQFATANEQLGGYQDYLGRVLSGEEPFDPLLMQDLQEQEAQVKESMRRNLGTGWESSTPAIETLGKFRTDREKTLTNARTQMLSSALQNVQGASNLVGGLEQQRQTDVANTQNSIGTQLQQKQGQVSNTLNQLLASQQGRSASMNQLLGVQGNQQQLGQNYASILQNLTQTPYSVSQQPTVSNYQNSASVLGQNTLGIQQPSTLDSVMKVVGPILTGGSRVAGAYAGKA